MAIAEVKLLLKSSSEASKKEIIKKGHEDVEQVKDYKDALKKFDTIHHAEYERI